MFDRILGIYPQQKVHIELLPGTKPMHLQPCPVPHMHLATFKCELDHLVTIGVLVPEWASPSFIILKKDGHVHWISDFCQLNKVIKCRTYPLPIILDILQNPSGNKLFYKI